MKYLATIALLFALALPAHAQNPGVSTTDPTTSGVTLILTGGTPPFNLWQWDGISTWNSRAVSVAGEELIPTTA